MRRFLSSVGGGFVGALLLVGLVAATPQQIFNELGGLLYKFPASHAAGALVNDGSGAITNASPVPPELLGSGTPTNELFLRGDSTWATLVALEEPLPAGMIVMFDGSCPGGWTRFTALDNRFPMGAAAAGTTGGASTHSHTVNAHGHGAGTLAAASHDHPAGTLAGGTHSHTADPPNTTSTNTSHNHWHTIPTGIGVNVQAGSDHNVAQTGLDTAGQNQSHAHDVNVASFNTGSSGVGISGSTGATAPAVSGTTATAAPGTDSPSSLPPYRTMVFCAKD